MTKKSFNQEENKPFDYFKEVDAAKKQEKLTTENLVTALRSDMLLASDAMPARKNIFQRVNLKLVVGIIIGLAILGLVWYTLVGPGRPILEQQLVSLMRREMTPTQQVKPSPLPATAKPPEPSKTPFRSPTVRPTLTQAIISIISPTHIPPTLTPTPTSECRDALTITLADVGQTLCVQGVVIETVDKPTNFMVIFSSEKGAFYWVSYDLVWSKGELDTCYRIHGTISQIGNSPVLVFGYSNLPEECP